VPVPRISREDLKAKLDNADVAARPIVLDVRLKYPYEHSTMMLPGSVRMSETEKPPLPRDREIVAYDSDPDELVSSRVVGDLIRAGYRASALKGGIVEWIEAKFPTDTKEAPKAAAPEPGSLKG
jgi:rhodanese-related sulfurtransferase